MSKKSKRYQVILVWNFNHIYIVPFTLRNIINMAIKILFIDDNDMFRKAVSNTLQCMNFDVTPLNDGKFVINCLKQNKYDIIVMDILMPDKDGFETIREIRKFDERIPIIAITGDGPFEFNQNLIIAEQLGANDSMMKPFNVSDLVEKINNILVSKH